jgi:hypothetical protein
MFKIVILSTSAILALALAVQAQYTPGVGGSFIRPSSPVVPGPTVPMGPTAPASPGSPTYSWETPVPPQPVQPIYQQQPGAVLAPAQPEAIRVVQPAIAMPRLNDSQIADLTASIALYPDPLLAVMLPSSTFVEDLCFADRWQEQHPGADERLIATLPVDDSVKAIMHYPAALDVMVGHLDWTQALSMAFTYQRQDLFESIQRWRTTAIAYGTLYTTPQQEVLRQGTLVLIQPPAQTQIVYVPVYDPAIVFVRPTVIRPARDYITFSTRGFALSFALNDVDWRSHEVRVPRHDERGPVLVGGGRDSGPRRDSIETREVFVPRDTKPGRAYPEKVITPQPDKKVISLPGSGRGPGGPGDRGDRGGPGGPGNR